MQCNAKKKDPGGSWALRSVAAFSLFINLARPPSLEFLPVYFLSSLLSFFGAVLFFFPTFVEWIIQVDRRTLSTGSLGCATALRVLSWSWLFFCLFFLSFLFAFANARVSTTTSVIILTSRGACILQKGSGMINHALMMDLPSRRAKGEKKPLNSKLWPFKVNISSIARRKRPVGSWAAVVLQKVWASWSSVVLFDSWVPHLAAPPVPQWFIHRELISFLSS